MSSLSLFDAVSLWAEGSSTVAPARNSAAENDDSDAAALDAVIRAMHAQVPAEGKKAVSCEELADALVVPADQRAPLLAAFLGAEVKSNGDAHVRLSTKVHVTIGDNTIVLGPDLRAKISEDKLEITTGFAIKFGFVTPRIRSVERGEKGGKRGIHVHTTMGSRFLPFA